MNFLTVMILAFTGWFQAAAAPAAASDARPPDTKSTQMTVPAGTKVLLTLRSPIDTKNARPGDPVYCQTSFPVTQDNVVVIPAGAYVKGQIMEVKRAGRIKGRAEVLFHFTTMIFPNGYTVDLPGALDSDPGATNRSVSDKEGTVKADSQKGKDAATIGKAAATGAGIGALATGRRTGAAAGGGIGAAAGLAAVLLTRGQDVHIEQGTSIEMVLQRPFTVDVRSSSSRNQTDLVPHATGGKLTAPREHD